MQRELHMTAGCQKRLAMTSHIEWVTLHCTRNRNCNANSKTQTWAASDKL